MVEKDGNNFIQCSSHPQLMEWLEKVVNNMGRHDAHIETSLKNQDEIFERLRGIETILEKRGVVNESIDKQITRLSDIASLNQKNIDRLKSHVENGLSTRTQTIEATVNALHDCVKEMERKKELDEATAKAGLPGFMAASWEGFKSKIGWLIPAIVIWVLVWGFVRAVVFHEYPFNMRKTEVPAKIVPDTQPPDVDRNLEMNEVP